MIKCPACGTENAVGSNFCISCGSDLNAAAVDQFLRADSAPSHNTSHATEPETSPEVPPEYLAPAGEPSMSGAASSQGRQADVPREYIETPAPAPKTPTYVPAPAYTPIASPASKTLSIALALEIVGGLFGLPGIGWIYAGQMTGGLILLGVMIAVDIIGAVLGLLTVFTSCFCSVPLIWVVMGVSAALLYNHAKNHPGLFSA